MPNLNSVKHKGTVLLIDDEVKILKSLSYILRKCEFNVLTATNGVDALDLLNRRDVDVVILDLVLSTEDGIDILKNLLKRSSILPVIILTGHGTIAKAVEAIRLGAFDFLEKPIESEKIIISIENAIKKSWLERERSVLLEDALNRYKMVGVSRALINIFALIAKAAPSDSRILITGESGTGKELIARTIHFRSPRAGAPFLIVNCAAIPEDLIESELFGHEKGAFTGAIQKREGKFKLASSGSLFLDEIGDMSLKLQAKVLRAIEEGEIQRVGGTDVIQIDPRIIAASNKDLKQAVREGQFREDLYFRLNVIDIHVPSLRERKEDIPILVDYFLKILCEEKKQQAPFIEADALEAIINYSWPGNIRELKNLIEKILVLYPNEIISKDRAIELLKSSSLREVPEQIIRTLSETRSRAEKEYILAKLLANNWDYKKAAMELGISRATLFNKMKKCQIKRKRIYNLFYRA